MDLRANKRHEINITADLKCGDAIHQAHVSDISAGGAKVELKNSTLSPGSDVLIDLPFLKELKASVAWGHGKSIGLKFQDSQNQLDEFLYNLAIYGTVNRA